MWWECSDCGGRVERRYPPVVCRKCGTAGVVYVPVEPGEAAGAEGLREAWLRAGLEAATARRAPLRATL